MWLPAGVTGSAALFALGAVTTGRAWGEGIERSQEILEAPEAGAVMLHCVDTSAWHRSANPVVDERWVAALEADEVALSDLVRLEIPFSARSPSDYESLADELAGLRSVPSNARPFARALEVQHLLARGGALHHRSVKIVDLLIAAAAEEAGAVVWHYDANYDRIAAVTGQPTEWEARRGSL